MAKVLKVIPLLLVLVLLAAIPAVISAKTENSSGALRTTVGQVAPSVSISVSPDAQVKVRLNSPVSVKVTFSEPVSGFTVDDISVVNGAASGFSGSGDVYTFDVKPNALDVVTVDIAAGVATDGEGNPNTAAPQLSLGIPYDFDGNGGISRAETIAAIRDYFGDNITRAQAIAVIRLYFSTPTEPEPEPSDDCIQTVSSDGTLNGQWASGCESETRSGSHARYYTFTLDASSEVTVRLESSAANAYLYLRRGDATSGTALHENDDHQGSTSVSQIQETLAAGTYTIEATTYAAGSTGSFSLTITGVATTQPPAGEFVSVSAGSAHTCGVRGDGSVACWGSNEDGQVTPPTGGFASVSAGYYHTCGVGRDGSVACWGLNRHGRATPPAGEFASVSAGGNHTCGVRRDGSASCWGSNGHGQVTPPAGEFVSVSAGSAHTCGVGRDGSVACWGWNEDGQVTPPAGEFASVSAGWAHTCAVKRDGSVACWGNDNWGQKTPPAGEFASVSAGGGHTCGVRQDGSVACWGSNGHGRATPPAGEFASVSAGNLHTCGVRRDGSVACWGDDEYGQATPPANAG